jgi:AraC-like DNA-binding protein
MGKYTITNFEHWSQFSDSVLQKKAHAYLKQPEMTDSAMACFSIIANRLYTKHGNLSRKELYSVVNAMFNMSTLYCSYYFDYSKAYTCLMEALNISRENDFSDMYPYIYMTLSEIYQTNDKMKRSDYFKSRILDNYKKAYQSAKEIRDWRILLAVFGNLTEYCFYNNCISECISVIQSFNGLRIPPMPYLKFNRHKAAGIKYYYEGHYDNALKEFALMKNSIDVNYEPERLELEAYMMSGRVLEKAGRKQDAFNYYQQAEQLALTKGVKDILVDIYEAEARCQKQGSAAQRAYHIKYLEMKDSIMNAANLENVSQMEFLNQLKDVNTQVKEISQKRKRQQAILICVSIFSVILISLLVYIFFKNRQLHRKNRILYQQTEKLLATTSKVRDSQNIAVETTNAQPKETEKRSNISDEETNRIWNNILDVMENNPAIFDVEFSMDKLAELASAKYKHVSQVINVCYGGSFHSLIGEYRLKEACRRLSDEDHYGHYTLEAIATSVGFKSRSHFVTAFKKFTGLTPSEYKRISKEKNINEDDEGEEG